MSRSASDCLPLGTYTVCTWNVHKRHSHDNIDDQFTCDATTHQRSPCLDPSDCLPLSVCTWNVHKRHSHDNIDDQFTCDATTHQRSPCLDPSDCLPLSVCTWNVHKRHSHDNIDDQFRPVRLLAIECLHVECA
ncbi:hypothetical protein Bbelb_212490 [Branchiostoma belcheri]|nr:hypothetical protein Bbelb_212490 [Branchiostoma belcheri]